MFRFKNSLHSPPRCQVLPDNCTAVQQLSSSLLLLSNSRYTTDTIWLLSSSTKFTQWDGASFSAARASKPVVHCCVDVLELGSLLLSPCDSRFCGVSVLFKLASARIAALFTHLSQHWESGIGSGVVSFCDLTSCCVWVCATQQPVHVHVGGDCPRTSSFKTFDELNDLLAISFLLIISCRMFSFSVVLSVICRRRPTKHTCSIAQFQNCKRF